MRRAGKWLLGVVLVLIGLPVVVVVALLVLANVNFGRRLIENQTASLTGGMVRIAGLSGRFPDALRADRIAVFDSVGPYVTVSGLELDWSPLKLASGVAQINLAHATLVDFARLPQSESSATTSNSSGSSFKLPVQVDLRDLKVDRLVVGAPVVGAAATLRAEGYGHLETLTEGSVHLDATRLDAEGRYSVVGRVTSSDIQAKISADEPAKGLISEAAHLPDLGAISLLGSVDGPKSALATKLGLTAGSLTASVDGTVDLDHEAASLRVNARAPEMSPAPDISWSSILVDANIDGPFAKPNAKGTVKIAALKAAGVGIGALAADVNGDAGQVHAHVGVNDLRVPGPKPEVFAGSPVTLDASARLDLPDRPFSFAVHHALLSAEGSGQAQGVPGVQAHVVLPDLSALAAIAGQDIRGSSELDIQAKSDSGTNSASLKGRVSVTGGLAPVLALIGEDGRIDAEASMTGKDISVPHLNVDGKALHVSATGGMNEQVVDLDWAVGLADLAAVQPSLAGQVDAKGHAAGKLDALAVHADIGADLAAKGYKSGHITANVDASGLPGAPHAVVVANGVLLDAPLLLNFSADEANGAVKVNIDKASWKSIAADGALSLTPPAVIPSGSLRLDAGRLADLEPLVGRPVVGQVNARLESSDTAANLTVSMRDAGLPGTAGVGKAGLNLNVADPAGHPVVDGILTTDGIYFGTTKSASAKVSAKGPLNAIGVNVTADAPDLAGGPAKLVTFGTVNADDRTLALAKMEAGWKQQVLKLLAPAKFNFSDGVAMDRLRLGFRQAELIVSGSAGKALDLTASLRNLPADVGAIVAPSLAADGVIAADARLTGTSAQPQGTIKLTADRVRLRTGPGQALPAANLLANVALLGTSAKVDAKLTAGPSHLSVNGTAPLSQSGALDLKTDGHVDLAMLDPILTAQGRRARGEVDLNAGITGTTAAPLIQGTADLRNGDVTDYALGAHITNLKATIQAVGDTIRLSQFSGKAGPGTIGGSGTIGLAGALPVDLRFTADNARPLSTDLLTALIDLNLTIQGEAKGDLDAAGTLHVRRADIRIPDKMPPSIAVLPVRNANAPPPPPPSPAPSSNIALNLTLDAPQQVFIRGRGLDAELGGTIHIHGTASAPIPDGGLHLRRGSLTVIGTTLNFTEGTIDFSGAGLADPSVHFVATSTTTTLVATLTVSGSAKDPKITLSSVPDSPQDEILSQLLFNTSTSKLNPLQLAQIAAALASLSGATSGIGDPLEGLRNAFGLDRLSVGSSSSGSPTLEAGRYVARGVYLGAKQSASGGGTQATVQVDLAKGLKLETTAGSQTSSATGAASSSEGTSVGLTYQFEY